MPASFLRRGLSLPSSGLVALSGFSSHSFEISLCWVPKAALREFTAVSLHLGLLGDPFPQALLDGCSERSTDTTQPHETLKRRQEEKGAAAAPRLCGVNLFGVRSQKPPQNLTWELLSCAAPRRCPRLTPALASGPGSGPAGNSSRLRSTAAPAPAGPRVPYSYRCSIGDGLRCAAVTPGVHRGSLEKAVGQKKWGGGVW